jgi:hypothetical protein
VDKNDFVLSTSNKFTTTTTRNRRRAIPIISKVSARRSSKKKLKTALHATLQPVLWMNPDEISSKSSSDPDPGF